MLTKKRVVNCKGRLFNSLLIFMLISFLLILGGCSSNASNGNASDNSSKQKVITIGAEKGSSYTVYYEKMAKEFTKETGIKVQWIEVPHTDVHSKFLTDAMSGSGAIDIYTYDQPWMYEFAKRGFLEPLDNKISPQDKKDFFPAALQTGSYNGKIYGLPFMVHTPVLYYRTDLFKKAGISGPPQTLQEYREDAKKLTDPANGIYGTIIEGKQAIEPTTHTFDAILQAGGSLLDNKGKVVFDSPAVLDAFNYMLAIQNEDKSSPPGEIGYDNADVHNMFVQGKAAMITGWPYVYAMASDKSLSKIVGNFDVAVQPAGKEKATAVWGLGYSVSSHSKNKDAAWEFVKWATSSKVIDNLGTTFINPVPRQSSLDTIKKNPNVTPNQMKALQTMVDALKYTKPVTENTKFQQLDDRLGVALSKILSGQSKPKDEIKAAADEMKNIVGQ